MLVPVLWAAVTLAADIPKELQQVAEQTRAITSLEATLTQEKELAALAEVVKNDGEFAFARPRKLLMDLNGPGGTLLVIDGDTMSMRYKTLNRTERTNLSKDARARAVAEHLFLLLEADPVALSKIYSLTVLTSAPLKVRLTPLPEALAKIIKSVEARFEARGLLTELVVNEQNGDRTRWQFSNHRINASIAAARFVVP